MQFEPVEPPDGALPPGGHPLKNPVVVYPSVVTDFDVGGINEIDPPGLTQATCFQEEHHGDGHPLLEGDEPAVGYHPGEVIPVMDQQMLGVEMLEICEMPDVEGNQDTDDFAFRKRCLPVSDSSKTAFNPVLFDLYIKFFAKVIHFNENFYNFIT